MAFTDVEMAILSQLAYSGATKETNRNSTPSRPPHKNESLYDLIKDNEEWLIARLGTGYKDAIEGLKNKTQNADYVIVAEEDDKEGTGFAAFAVCDPDNNITVSCRGTEGFKLFDENSQRDINADIELALSISTAQQRKMRAFVNRLEKIGYNGYFFTGHSLGGNLATYGAIFLSDSDKLLGCVTFNAPGFNSDFLEENKFRISRVEDKIISFQNERDPISECFVVIGNVVVLECGDWVSEELLSFESHDLSALVINDDGSFKPNSDGKKKETFLGNVAETLATAGDFLFDRMRNYFIAKEKMRNGFRDFSQEAKQMLVGAAKETEDEHWWEVSKWDCWYKVEKFFGTLEWDLYAGKVDTYYRKLIDINDASVKDIEKIFANIYKLDSSYSSTINIATDVLKTKVTNNLKALRESIIVN